jgi:hypothetical protein
VLGADKKLGLEVNGKETNNMFKSRDKNSRQKHNIKAVKIMLGKCGDVKIFWKDSRRRKLRAYIIWVLLSAILGHSVT